MSKYYYVGLANRLSCSFGGPVTLQHDFDGYDNPTPFKINNVHYTGGIYNKYSDFPMICEVINDYFVDLVTGEAYYKSTDCSRNILDIYLRFYALEPVSQHEVAEQLRELSYLDIIRYKKGISLLKKMVASTYQEEINRPEIIKKQAEEDANFIKKFIKKYH